MINSDRTKVRGEGCKGRIKEADFVRAISCIGIVIFHFSATLDNYSINCSLPLYYYGNGDWGKILVTVFFMLSGAMLWYNEKEITLIYYYKRWKSIYPMFYLAFGFNFFKNILSSGKVFYNGKPWTLLLSLLGMDGYFSYRIKGYYILGEWFLGAIIFMYLLYPLLVHFMNRYKIPATIIIILFFIGILNFNGFIISESTNIFTCLISFWFGMLCMEYIAYWDNKYVAIIALVLFFIFGKLDIQNKVVVDQLCGWVLFIFLMNIGKIIMKNKLLDNIFSGLSKLSYPIFLLHHIILFQVINKYKEQMLSDFKVYILLSAIIVLILCEAWILYLVHEKVIKGGVYIKIENKVKKLLT